MNSMFYVQVTLRNNFCNSAFDKILPSLIIYKSSKPIVVCHYFPAKIKTKITHSKIFYYFKKFLTQNEISVTLFYTLF